MKRFLRSKLVLSLVALVMLAGTILIPFLRSHTPVAHAATATVTDIPNPDNYTCAQSGFITFENMADGTNLSANAINGVQFTTTNGYTWLVGDFATGNYNGKYPHGGYTSQGTHWAWLGPNQGAGRIDFVNGPASIFSLLTSDNNTPVEVDAYKADGTLLAIADPAALNYNTGHMSELKITRDTADIKYVIVHDTGNFFLIDSVCTDAPGVPYQALYDFKQNVNADGSTPSWAKEILYYDTADGCPNMFRAGCAITSVTDIIASYGLKSLPSPEPPNTPVDPFSVNDFLSKVSGTNSKCGIIFETAGHDLGYKMTNFRPWVWSIIDPKTNKPLYVPGDIIDQALNLHKLVTLGMHVNNPNLSHFIVVYQGTVPASDGSHDYLIVDPYMYLDKKTGLYSINNSTKPLSKAYDTLNNLLNDGDGLQVVVVDNNTSTKPWTSWAVVAHSPVQMLITDPNGAQTGFDPATGKNLLNIPESSYGVDDPIDDSGTLPPQPSELSFGQNDVKDGTYKVQIIGTGTGSYKLDFAIASPGKSTLQTLTGSAIPGQIDTYNVSFAQGHLENIVRQVSIDIKPGEDPTAINPTSNGKTPVALLSTPTFDATQVNLSTIKFGPANAPAVDKQLGIEDVNGDGLPDVVFHFNTNQTGIKAGDTQACLTGQMTDGTNIIGCDTFHTVPPGS